MNVEELIQALSGYPPETEVTYNGGDQDLMVTQVRPRGLHEVELS